MQKTNKYDVIVIGGGPAGCTAAALLAEKGWRVLLLEKERFPRYRIGESMIPFCYFPLQRLGLLDKMRNSHFTKKYSVQFASTNGNVSQPFYFFQHYDHPSSMTWQVVRSEFDQMMLDNARDKGATVYQGMKVRDFLREGDAVTGVIARDEDDRSHEFTAPITIDATGRESLAVVRNNWRVPDPELRKVAIWTYYRGAKRDPGLDEGATTVAYVPEKGWFWYLPLPEDVVSVGIVADKEYLYRETRDPETIFQREVKNNPWVEEHLAPGKREGDYRVTGDYSYRSKYCAQDGLVLIGDAFAFLDPVFSSGILLALLSGELAADAVDQALAAADTSAAQFSEYSEKMCTAIEAMRKLVYAFYDQTFNFRELFEKYPQARSEVTDVLIGNLFKDFSQLFQQLAEFANVPEDLRHGRPLVAAGARLPV